MVKRPLSIIYNLIDYYAERRPEGGSTAFPKGKMIVRLWEWLKSTFMKVSQVANNEHSSVERRQLQIYLFKPEPPLKLYKSLFKSDARSFNHKKKRRKKK